MDSKPVLPMDRPFAEMGYNSSGLNIVLERLLLATRRPSTHYPLASGAAFFDPLRAICRRATNHLQHTADSRERRNTMDRGQGLWWDTNTQESPTRSKVRC